jgi:glycosyltransferase involved in cell wall biosynthesis
MARVSVILPVHNGASTIARAIDSVFAQSFTDYEIVVVDDGSTDESASVLSGYGDRIRVISQSNRGVSASRNAGMRSAAGDYIAFLDDDDEWMPEMLARCASVLDQDPNCVLAYAGVLRVDLTGAPMPNQESQTDSVDSPTLAQMLARPWIIVPSQFMVRRAVLERCDGFDERLMGPEDAYFLLMAREYGYFRGVPQLLVRKATRPLYPKALNREPQCDLFCQLVGERYGASASGFIREFRIKRMKVMKHMARVLLEEGRIRDARRCLARVIHYQPTSVKAYRRYLRTFIPRRMHLPRRTHLSTTTPQTASRAKDSEA